MYPVIFGETKAPSKPHSPELNRFSNKWGWQKTLYELSGEEIEKIAKTAQIYLTTVLQFLTYSIEKGWVDEQEDKFQDNLRKQRKH